MQFRVSLPPLRRQVSCYQEKIYKRISSAVVARLFIGLQYIWGYRMTWPSRILICMKVLLNGYTAEVFSIGFHGISERKDGVAIVPTIWKSGVAVLGSSSVGARILCKYHWTGRRKDQEILPVAGETGKASRSGARKVIRLGDTSKRAPSRRIIPKPPPLAVVVYSFGGNYKRVLEGRQPQNCEFFLRTSTEKEQVLIKRNPGFTQDSRHSSHR